MEMNSNQKCFVSTLARLRESSKDAVISADANTLDPYTKYMHIERPVQEKFISILEKSYNTDHAELILLCGSVGDGKSHMLSYCKTMFPEKMSRFYVHNDSTASFYIDKPASYTLMSIMEDFADDRIEYSKKKVILAINLGTLSNFIDSDIDNKFTRFRKYIDESGILDEKIGNDIHNDYFHSVNFADYHLYELRKDGIDSKYIRGILEKITNPSTDNDFYNAFCSECHNCKSRNICPVKANYELLQNKEIQQGVIESIVESIIKNKLIVSTRTLLNMIYEIVVDERVWNRGSLEPRKEPTRMTSIAYCESLLPNILFGKKNSSEILDSLSLEDPMRIRNENVDDFIVFYENTNEVVEVFTSDLQEYSALIDRFVEEDFSDRSLHAVREEILKLYVRICWLTKRRTDLLPLDEDYQEYVKALYAWNTGDCQGLNKVYKIVENGVLLWNGQAEKDEMQLCINGKKVDYHLIQKIQIKRIADNLGSQSQEELFSFKDELRLKYKYSMNQEAELDVDFALFSLLKRVIRGYVPSISDKRVNVKCVEFINRISQGGSKAEQLIIRDLTQKEAKEYRVTYEEGFGYSFEVN